MPTSPDVLAIIDKAKAEEATFIDLGNCGLTELPNELFELTGLEAINLGTSYQIEGKWRESANTGYNNQLSGKNLSRLAVFEHTLTTLHLYHCKISNYGFLEKLTQLQSLDLRLNRISDYGFLEKLTQLQFLVLSENQIDDTRFLEKLTQLQSLDLRLNSISDIRSLEKLTQLQSLDLSENLISDIRSLEKLARLQSLGLSLSNISDYGSLEKLTQLQFLDLSYNQISDYGFLEKLAQLQSLVLSENQISDTRFLEKLTQLQSLDLRYNQIRDIRFLEKLTQLQSLYLRQNLVSNIRSLEKLTQLQSLDLRSNQISDASSIEVVLKNSPQLRTIYLDKGIVGIPAGLEENSDELRAYFKRLNEEQQQPNRTLKLILLGNTRAGKSQLLNFLQGRAYKSNSDSTPGIQIELWANTVNETPYRIMCFDFGGQDFYHATHNLYLDSNTLYLTLWHPQVVDQGQHLPPGYWLGNIDYFTAGETNRNMAIWTIQSRADEGAETGTDRTRENIPTELVNLYTADPEGQFYLSVQEAQRGDTRWLIEWNYFKQHLNRKIEELTRKAAPYTQETTMVRDTLLPKLRAEGRMLIEQADFLGRCDELFNRRSEKKAYDYVLSVLRATGELLWYREIADVAPYLIIDPGAWSELIFTILDDETRQKNGGEFSRFVLEEAVQKNKAHPTEKKVIPHLFVTLLQYYQIIFEKPDTSDQFVVPQYLPELPLAKRLQKLIPLTFAVCYEHYMPFWRISNFIALKGATFTDTDYWRYGIIYEENGCSVMVRVQRPAADGQDNEQKLYIHIEGEAAQRTALLIEILDFFTRVYRFNSPLLTSTKRQSPVSKLDLSRSGDDRDDLPGALTQHEKATFVKKIQFSTNNRDFFCVDQIENSLAANEKFLKNVEGKTLPVPALFYAVFNQQNTMPKRIFFSYAHADAPYRLELDTHFAALKRGKSVETWHDMEILPGTDWHERIMEEIEKADLVLALISPDFMNSSFIWEQEIPKMKSKFVPIFLRPCDFGETIIAPVQGLPKHYEDGADKVRKGISWIVSSHWQYRDEAYLAVIEGLRRIL